MSMKNYLLSKHRWNRIGVCNFTATEAVKTTAQDGRAINSEGGSVFEEKRATVVMNHIMPNITIIPLRSLVQITALRPAVMRFKVIQGHHFRYQPKARVRVPTS